MKQHQQRVWVAVVLLVVARAQTTPAPTASTVTASQAYDMLGQMTKTSAAFIKNSYGGVSAGEGTSGCNSINSCAADIGTTTVNPNSNFPGPKLWYSPTLKFVTVAGDPPPPSASFIPENARTAACVLAPFNQTLKDNFAQLPYLLGEQFFGDQDTGLLLDFPGVQWTGAGTSNCGANYDARFRPWYANAVSGPKDVVLVIDTSGSMLDESRLPMAKSAAKAVLLTLSNVDYATVIEFSTSASAFAGGNGKLVPVTDANRELLNTYIDSLTAVGRTNYEAAMTKAFEFVRTSREAGVTSGCKSVMLFLTDGEITQGSTDIVSLTDELNDSDYDMRIFTYSLGDDAGVGAPAETLRKIACANRGIWFNIPSGSSSTLLKDTMAKYYTYLASNTDQENVRWTQYYDVVNNDMAFSACLPLFDTAVNPPRLFGVHCTDSFTNKFSQLAGFDAVNASIIKASKTCSSLSLTEAELETLRVQANPEASCVMATESASVGAIVGGVVGGVVGIALIAAIVFFVKKKSAGTSNKESFEMAPKPTAPSVNPDAGVV